MSDSTGALWEHSDFFFFFAFSRCYDSLKDFYDIYEVAALKWKVSVRARPEREQAVGSLVLGMGGEPERHPRSSSSQPEQLSRGHCRDTGRPWSPPLPFTCSVVSQSRAQDLRPHLSPCNIRLLIKLSLSLSLLGNGLTIIPTYRVIFKTT